jgi:histidinol-phosphate aminotransferase
MSRFFDLVSTPAREMGSYLPSARATPSGEPPTLRFIKLDSNENPFGPSPRAIEAMQSALAAANSYPDDDSDALRRRLAAYHGLAIDQILVAAGSTALLSLLCQTMLAPGLNAVTCERSFIVYSAAVHATGAQFIETPMREDGIDLDAILAAINDHTRIVFLANPNNPTGTMLGAAAIDRFVAAVPGHVVVVLDEAYYDFALAFAGLRQLEYSRSLDYVRRGASVVVLRTFSKAHGLAGLRVGYGLGPAELLGYCARMRNTFSVSSVAQAAAVAALDDEIHIRRVVANNVAQAQILAAGLSELGFRVIPTAANFLCCDVGEDAYLLANYLRGEGVSVRPLGAWGAPNCIRVSIGTPEQNQIFLDAARRVATPSQRAARR